MPLRVQVADREPDSILIVGATAFDDIITPEDSREHVLGGAAIYTALAARFFAEVHLRSVVGYDFERNYLDELKSLGLDVSGIDIDSEKKTFYWKSQYSEGFKHREVLAKSQNSFGSYRPELSDELASIPFVMLSNQDPGFQLHILRQLRKDAFVVVDTIISWIEEKRAELMEVVSQCSLLCINENEARVLSGKVKIEESGSELMRMGADAVIIKKGVKGAVLFHEEGVVEVSAYRVERVVDPTGAGDSFIGGVLGYLAAVGDCSYASIQDAIYYGTAMASLAIEAFSCEGLIAATVERVEERYASLRG